MTRRPDPDDYQPPIGPTHPARDLDTLADAAAEREYGGQQ